MSRINQQTPKRGEIWLAQFSPQVGRELASPHPARVVSRDDVDALPLRIVVPINSWQQRFSAVPWMPELRANAANGLKKPQLRRLLSDAQLRREPVCSALE